ncbi:unnamed protein product [Peronospora belbahrii]|uniref:FYVE-type domain-containing protein n=1 Tax=Peronospora belbahrii TaxID=622444 RepID=A0ABN8CQ47_9STRA|nr:unnamed protein product [Peronospora belbahrii]
MLEFPLHDGFFPQIALSREEVKYYKRLGKERVTQLIRIIEDAECAYKWTSIESVRRTHRSRLPRHTRLSFESKDNRTVACQRASFLDFQPVNKTTHASTLLKASVQLSDTKVEEILRAVAKVKTKDFRKTMQYMHTDGFVDGRTLFTFPQQSTCSGSDVSHCVPSRASSSYRAIKWHAFKTQRSRHREDNKLLDFCFLEYAGKRKAPPGSNVVGFCVQESISREREVPTLENFGIARGYLSRMGLIISKTHQKNTFKVTSICQIDGDLNPIVRGVLEELMKKTVCAVAKIPGLVARQRVSSLRFVEQWQWVPNSDRKACAVCLRGFYFRRKHHCRTCGEVVCSSCAMLRELEEPIFDITHLRVCSTCMTSAGARQQQQHLSALSATGTGDEPASSTSNDTESYIRGLRSPQHNSYEDMIFRMRESRDRDRRQSDLAMEVLEADTELKPANSSLNIDVGSQLLTRDKVHALTDVVTNIREVRDTINLTMSEAAYKERREDDSDEIEEFNDMYSEITSIQEALENSVSNFDAALANATNAAPAMYYSGTSDRSQDSLRGGGSERDIGITANQFNSVARITFAAARVTRQAGQAFLSVGERQYLPREDHNVPGKQEKHGDKQVLASSVSVASYPTVYDSEDSSVAQSPDPYSASNYEKIMATYLPEQDYSEHEDEDNRHSLYNFADSVRRATKIHELEKKIFDLQRSLEEAQRKVSVIDSDEPEPEARSRRLDVLRDHSAQVEIESVFEIFGERGKQHDPILGDTVSPVSSGPRTMSLPSGRMESRGLTTKDLVSELRGVMASSETPICASSGSRRSLLRSSTAALPSNVVTNALSPVPPNLPVSPPLATGKKKKKKLSQKDDTRQSANKSLMPKERPVGGDLNISKGSVKANHRGQVQKMRRPSAAPTEESYLPTVRTTGDTRYGIDGNYAALSSDEDSYDDSSDDSSLLTSDDAREPYFKKYRSPDAFFVEEDLGALLKTRKAAEANASLPIDPVTSPSFPLPPAPAMGIDERDELRELMAGLVRPRSSSLPFQSGQMGGASSGESLHNKPSWSDDAPDRVPTAHQVEEAVYEIHACLASCRCECPSDTERIRKLTSIFKVLRSLHREGVRSKFRTLQHDDIRYAKMLKTNPSIIKLLKLAGYVSLQQKLTMKRVDQDYLALFLRELERELYPSTDA